MNANPDERHEPCASDRPADPDIVPAELVAKSSIFLDPSRRMRTVWRFLIFGVGFVVVNVVVSMIVGIGLVVYVAIFQGPESLRDPVSIQEQMNQYMPVLMAMASVPMTLTLLGWVVICRKYLDQRSIASMGFVRPERRPSASVTVGLLAGLLPIAAAAGAVFVAGGFRLSGFGFSVPAGLLVPTLVLMAFVEELVFRSYLLQNLLDIRRPVFGVFFTSIFFWLAHALNPHVWTSLIIPLNMFGAGVILALAYMVSRNVWFPTALHFGWNVAQGVLLGLPISGLDIEGLVQLQPTDKAPVWLTGGKFGLEGSLAVTVAEALLIGGFLLLLLAQTRRDRRGKNRTGKKNYIPRVRSLF